MPAPKHVAVIPDGNRRWAASRMLRPWDGHIEGVKRFWDVADAAYAQGVTHLTIWALSYDNLTKRTKLEVNFLLKLIREELQKPDVLQRCLRNKVRFQVIGEWRALINDPGIISGIEHLENETKHFENKILTLLFVYDGQREMLASIKSVMTDSVTVTSANLRKELWTGHLPDVDLVIRTGGEPHWSAGFMMWLTANSQFYFTEMLWPAFGARELGIALESYAQRVRRKGK